MNYQSNLKEPYAGSGVPFITKTASLAPKFVKMIHMGDVIREKIDTKGVDKGIISDALKVSKRMLYKIFDQNKVAFEKVAIIGAVINYDFSKDFPAMKDYNDVMEIMGFPNNVVNVPRAEYRSGNVGGNNTQGVNNNSFDPEILDRKLRFAEEKIKNLENLVNDYRDMIATLKTKTKD